MPKQERQIFFGREKVTEKDGQIDYMTVKSKDIKYIYDIECYRKPDIENDYVCTTLRSGKRANRNYTHHEEAKINQNREKKCRRTYQIVNKNEEN